jgi:hypothetical protein
VVEQANLRELTRYFLTLKRQFFPGAILPNHQPPVHVLDWVLAEVKGADIRRQARSPSRRKRRHAIGFLDRFVRMLGYFDAKIIGRIWIKGIGTPMNGRSIYTYSIPIVFGTMYAHRRREPSANGFLTFPRFFRGDWHASSCIGIADLEFLPFWQQQSWQSPWHASADGKSRTRIFRA